MRTAITSKQIITWESNMNILVRAVVALLFTLLAAGVTIAHETAVRQDPRAVEVLKNMATYTASLDRFMITGETFTDASVDFGLIISNARESRLFVDRPGSLFVTSFDGMDESDIYIHDGMLTVFSSKHNFYARTSVPDNLETALHFALDEIDVETPLMDFVFADSLSHLVKDHDTVIYLTDKSRIRGVDCHHVVVRAPGIDLQLWIEEGDRPVPRKVIITSVSEPGSPRHYAFMDWRVASDLDSAMFEFDAPENSVEIEFVAAP